MKKLGSERLREAIYRGELVGGEGLLNGQAGEFHLPNGFSVQHEPLDRVRGAMGEGHPLCVADYLLAYDGFGGFGFAAAHGLILSGDLLEIVDIVDEAAFDVVDSGGDIAGDGDVDEEDGAVFAALKESAGVVSLDDLGLPHRGGTCAGDDDVGAVGLLVELVERNHACGDRRGAERVGDLLGAVFGAVADEQRGAALLDEVAGGEVGHLARADEQDGLGVQRAEDLPGELGGDRGDGDGGAADLGFGADLFGNGEGTLKKGVERRLDGADFPADGPGLLDLAEDLGFANS